MELENDGCQKGISLSRGSFFSFHVKLQGCNMTIEKPTLNEDTSHYENKNAEFPTQQC